MFENSAAGITVLAAEVPVTVTREEDHQPVLARYSPPSDGQREVVVELAWCTIGAGKYRGERAIEVRLDGLRAGELTYLMSQRYAGLVRQFTAQGARPGCAAVVERSARGLQLTLRLPKDTERVVPLATERPDTTRVVPAAREKARRPGLAPHLPRNPAWILAGAAVVVIFLFGAILGSGDEEPDPAGVAATETTEITEATETTTTPFESPPTTTTAAVTTTTTTTTTTVPLPPPPPPPTQQPVQPPVVEQPPQPSQCDPNYSGCVPVAPDVDCAGGSGNGPAYADGPVDVVGSDIYDLDRDKDGVACE